MFYIGDYIKLENSRNNRVRHVINNKYCLFHAQPGELEYQKMTIWRYHKELFFYTLIDE